ncbi:hypothetical protein EST38_g10510 [Candolleomyces aberdarensis]|uniref:Uncharacterized protein n=1 Tax=Candolleomyces aberdarensis TaxID=2316362 RepID=A0A4Q2DAH8_9AGAR|nr:hypothetical protein EST38_g10510 [Candolleomyces aberdarensis]
MSIVSDSEFKKKSSVPVGTSSVTEVSSVHAPCKDDTFSKKSDATKALDQNSDDPALECDFEYSDDDEGEWGDDLESWGHRGPGNKIPVGKGDKRSKNEK